MNKRAAASGFSRFALLVGLAGLPSAYGQEASAPLGADARLVDPTQTVQVAQLADQQPPPRAGAVETLTAEQAPTESDRVVITGSLIATTPEDAPKPVEVYGADELRQLGNPTVTDFIRDLSVSSTPAYGYGEANPMSLSGNAPGFSTADLRGLGSNATLSLLNGHRIGLSPTTTGGLGADITAIPSNALQAVEILKDGASTTYGGGAVGGVINFITRRDVDAPEIRIERKMYDGGEGALDVSFLTGWVGDASNFLLSYEYHNEAPMLMSKRDWSSPAYTDNPDAWSYSNGTNPGNFVNTTNFLTGTPALATPTPANRFIPDRRTAADCTAIGGQVASVLDPALVYGTSPNPSCAFPLAPTLDLVNENTTHKIFASYDSDLTDTMRFHVDALYAKSETETRTHPGEPVSASNGATLPTGSTAATQNGCLAATGCQFVIPVQQQTYTTAGAGAGAFTRNPFIDDFIQRTGATVANTSALYTALGWRPFEFGGNPLYSDGLQHRRYQREQIRISAGFDGEFEGDGFLGFLEGVGYNYNAQYGEYLLTDNNPDVMVSRLQNALLGYGGSGCQAFDRVATDYSTAASYNRTVGIQSDTVPGTSGCLYFNPFASAWATSVINGGANPQYGGTAYENSRELVDWLTADQLLETESKYFILSSVWTGTAPVVQLPGGDIGWALGAEWRQAELRTSPHMDDAGEQATAMQYCPWPDQRMLIDGRTAPGEAIQAPGQRGCSSTTQGAFLQGDPLQVRYADQQALAYYAEVHLPVLDNLNFQASIRREDYNDGALVGDIYGVAGKWEPLNGLYIRGSYNTNFRAQGLEYVPGETTQNPVSPPRFGGTATFANVIQTDPNLGPEKDKSSNIGIGYHNDDVLGGRFDASADFFEILIDGEIIQTSTPTILGNIFGPNIRGVTPADCSARLISYVVFDNGNTCTQGVTTSNNLVAQLSRTLNGPGLITNGFDYAVTYSHDLFDGMFSAQLRATQNRVYKWQGFYINGLLFQASGDKLGYESSVTANGQSVPEWKGNLVLRWANDNHNISLRTTYQSGLKNRSYYACFPPYYDPATGTQVELLSGDTACGATITPLYPLSAAPLEPWKQFGAYASGTPQDSLTFDINYIYTAPFWEELKLRASVLNITDEHPQLSEGKLGYIPGSVNPRGRMFELEITKSF